MKLNNKYGYKVCFQELGKTKFKVYLVTNTLDGAIWSVRWYETHKQRDRTDYHILNCPIWHIYEVKTLEEYEKLWKDCPFKDGFSD